MTCCLELLPTSTIINQHQLHSKRKVEEDVSRDFSLHHHCLHLQLALLLKNNLLMQWPIHQYEPMYFVSTNLVTRRELQIWLFFNHLFTYFCMIGFFHLQIPCKNTLLSLITFHQIYSHIDSILHVQPFYFYFALFVCFSIHKFHTKTSCHQIYLQFQLILHVKPSYLLIFFIFDSHYFYMSF